MADRPTFSYRDKPVRAAGVFLYTVVRGRRVRLMRRVNGKWEDMGGKSDPEDASAMHTAAREACEETNGKLFSAEHGRDECMAILLDLLRETRDIEYNARCKYLLFKVRVSPKLLKYSMRRFGRSEKTDWGVLHHYYQWRHQLPPRHKLHFRLRGLRL